MTTSHASVVSRRYRSTSIRQKISAVPFFFFFLSETVKLAIVGEILYFKCYGKISVVVAVFVLLPRDNTFKINHICSVPV